MTTGISFQNGSYTGGTATAGTFTTTGGISVNSLYNTEYLDSKYDYADTKEGYEMTYVGRDAAIDTQISNVISQLAKGNEDKALSAYNKLIEEMSTQGRYENLEGTQLTAVARQLIESQLGSSLEDYIVDNAANSFERGFEINWEGDSATESDLLMTMCDIDSTTSLDGVKKAGGVAAKVGLTGGAVAAGAAIGSMIPGLGTVCGAIVGGIVGGAITLFRK